MTITFIRNALPNQTTIGAYQNDQSTNYFVLSIPFFDVLRVPNKDSWSIKLKTEVKNYIIS